MKLVEYKFSFMVMKLKEWLYSNAWTLKSCTMIILFEKNTSLSNGSITHLVKVQINTKWGRVSQTIGINVQTGKLMSATSFSG